MNTSSQDSALSPILRWLDQRQDRVAALQGDLTAFREAVRIERVEGADGEQFRVVHDIREAVLAVGGQGGLVHGLGEQFEGDDFRAEAVLEANPEAIIATGMGDAKPEWLHDWDKWTRMTAVARGNLFHINPDIMQRHTPRILDGTTKLCAHLDVARSHRPAR